MAAVGPHGVGVEGWLHQVQGLCEGANNCNDPAERGVGLIKQFIASFQNEKSCQDNLLAISEHRKIVVKDSKKSDLSKVGVL